jgi:hypothetical protein
LPLHGTDCRQISSIDMQALSRQPALQEATDGRESKLCAA